MDPSIPSLFKAKPGCVKILGKNYPIATTTHLYLSPNGEYYIDSPSIQDLGQLINLEDLNLSSVDLTIFPNIQNLVHLKKLRLYNNKFQTLPDYIGNLENLTSLEISWQKNLILIPYSIGKLKNLESLDIDLNENLRTIPDSICNLKKLTRLFLKGNGLTSLPQDIGLLTNLSFLSVENNQLTTLPDSIGNLKEVADSKEYEYYNEPIFDVSENPYTDPELQDKKSDEIMNIMKKRWHKRTCIDKKKYTLAKIRKDKITPLPVLANIIDFEYPYCKEIQAGKIILDFEEWKNRGASESKSSFRFRSNRKLKIKSKRKTSKRKTSKRKTSKRKTSKRKVSRRKASRRKASKRKVSRRKASKRKASRRKASKRKASKGKTSRRKTSRRKVSKRKVSKRKASKRKASKRRVKI